MKKIILAILATLLVIGFISGDKDVISDVCTIAFIVVMLTIVFYLFYLFIELIHKIIKYLDKNSK